MFKLFLSVLCFSVLFISLQANAGQGSGWGEIQEVYINGEGTVVRLRFSKPIVNPDVCGGTGNAEFYIRELDETKGSNRFLSSVLAAHTAKKTVNFWVDGCSQWEWWGKKRPKINDIYIKD